MTDKCRYWTNLATLDCAPPLSDGNIRDTLAGVEQTPKLVNSFVCAGG